MLKRIFDISASFLGLLILSPVFLILWILICKKMNPPALFTQTRAGLNGEPFKLYKFRTMTNEKDSDGNLLPDEKRLTSFGKFLRSTSLDELPQLWNVLKGDMSLVGPRPLLMQYVPLYNPRQKTRLNVKPGVTGWAQIHGRNSLNWKDKFELDAWYVENQSFFLDMKILFMTVKKVISHEGISAQGEATMYPFTGE